MKKKFSILASVLFAVAVSAQDVKLPAPDMKQKSMTVVDALRTRHSVRNFDTAKELSRQELSNTGLFSTLFLVS